MSERDHLIARWFETALTEREAHALVGHVPGALHYRTVVSWAILPEDARKIIRREYAITHLVAEKILTEVNR